MNNIYLKEMTKQMYHEYFKEYENDINLWFDRSKYHTYKYNEENVNEYIDRQINKKRIPLAIMLNNIIIGEIIIKDIEESKKASFGIAMKNDNYKNKGYGSKAISLVIKYIFNQLDIQTIYVDALVTNLRSQHVLEKNGFIKIRKDDMFIYYNLNKLI